MDKDPKLDLIKCVVPPHPLLSALYQAFPAATLSCCLFVGLSAFCFVFSNKKNAELG